MAVPHLLKGHSALLAAQTGTGKTLAYTLPIINRLKQDEIGAKTQLTLPNRPRALILVPSRELVQQVV
jgi:superfamily II DNA/RNA helicase